MVVQGSVVLRQWENPSGRLHLGTTSSWATAFTFALVLQVGCGEEGTVLPPSAGSSGPAASASASASAARTSVAVALTSSPPPQTNPLRPDGRPKRPCPATEDLAGEWFTGLSSGQRAAVNCFVDKFASLGPDHVRPEAVCDRRLSEVSCCVPYEVSSVDAQGYFVVGTVDLDLGPSRVVMRISTSFDEANGWELAPTDLASMRQCGCRPLVRARNPGLRMMFRGFRAVFDVAEWLYERRPYLPEKGPDYGLSSMLRSHYDIEKARCN